MSESRFAPLSATSLVMPPHMRLVAGLVRSMAPSVNCVIFAITLVEVHEVSAMELVQMIVSTKVIGTAASASSQGTPKNQCVSHTPTALRIGMPTNDTHSGSSMSRSTSEPDRAGPLSGRRCATKRW
jgi:hypothetical protein